jgi:O-antigen/teichoic acid export membrane protein
MRFLQKLQSRLPNKENDKSLVRNSLWMFVGQGLAIVSQALYFIAIARLLGSAEYGLLMGAAAAISVVSQFSPMGAGLLFLRYVSHDHTLYAKYWGNILISTLSIGTLLVAALACGSRWLLHDIDLRIVFLLAISDCIFGQLMSTIGQIFQAFEQLRVTALMNLVTNTARMLLAVCMLVTLHKSNALTWAIASCSISLLMTCVATVTVIRSFGLPDFRPHLFLERLREGFTFAVSGSTTSIYNDVDKVMLAHFGLNAANGIYTMAYRVVDIGTLPTRSVHAAAFPRFFREGATGKLGATVPLAKRLLKRTSVIGLAMAVAMFLVAPLVPRILGDSFQASVSAMRWLCLIPFFRSFHLSAGDALAGAGRQSLRLTFQAVAAIINIALNLILIPRFSWLGAAWASLATDCFLGILLWSTIYVLERHPKPLLRPLADLEAKTAEGCCL